VYSSPPEWSDWGYGVAVGPNPTNSMSSLFGYSLNDEALQNGAFRGLAFHTDRDVYRLLHQLGPNVYGVISGTESGIWSQCPVPYWGEFIVTPVPIPPTIFLLGSGFFGLIGVRRRFKK